ncbi:hypothetical protein EG68_00707 [Paragonimus skrjabini miyazakii]|uniref:Band 4.1 domain-containing protein n=1 Tax=Paragonimus skrjabini miyazakii TaxID=59628 RepID=A0A8S9ZCK3_9TREM|nr:hypothetical protein EG68_00707 [Paragonimus skrjabini miyazakii]
MIADGHYVDGSWLLTVHIDELDIDRQVRVQGDWSVGEVLAQLTEGLTAPAPRPTKPNEISLRSGTLKTGWSERCLWWPAKCRWLTHSRVSLNQYGLQADALLRLVPIYGCLKAQLPDLQLREFVDVNYAEPVFRVIVSICRHLNIRHPEELSLAYPITQSDLKHSRFIPVIDRRQHVLTISAKHPTFQRSATISTTHTQTKQLLVHNSSNKENAAQNGQVFQMVNGVRRRDSQTSQRLFGPPRVRDRRSVVRVSATNWGPTLKTNSPSVTSVNYSPGSMHTLAFEFRSLEDPSLACSPVVGVDDACLKGLIVHPTSFMQRLRLNATWLDSAKSLMEQGIDMRPMLENEGRSHGEEHVQDGLKSGGKEPGPVVGLATLEVPTLVLRYKYGSFYDLNPKYDIVRINQLYEQAKWSVISELIEATDDEACLLAALQAHVEIATEREERELERLSNSLSGNGYDRTDSKRLSQLSVGLRKPTPSDGLLRDTSPIGGYLRHHHNPKLTKTRPLSVVELESEIDAMLDELSISAEADITSIGGGRSRSRSRKRVSRPLSQAVNLQNDQPSDPGPPQLRGYIKICKPRRFGLKVFRRLFTAVEGLKFLVYKTEEEYESKNEAVEVIYLPGCEVQPDLCLTSERYSVRLFVPISRTNLPLSAAFALGSTDDPRGQEEELGVSGRLRRRASLLSLTSLSHFGATFGLQTTGGSPGSGGLCGASAAVLGLMNEIVLRFNDLDSYADWLAYLRLATAVPTFGLSVGEDQPDWDGTVPKAEWATILARSVYDEERKAILGLIHLIRPNSVDKTDQVDSPIQITALHERLEKRLTDFLPMRLSQGKNVWKGQNQKSRDQTDSTVNRSGTLPADARPPPHSTNSNVAAPVRSQLTRRICIAYSRIHELNSLQAKLKYISAWEQMPNHGIAFFPARVEVTLPLASLLGEDGPERSTSRGGVPWMHRPLGGGNVTVSCSRRIEAIGIGPTRVFRCDLQSGDIMASWRLSAIQGWHINWELGELVLLLAPPAPKQMEGRRSASPITSPPGCVGRVVIKPVDVSVRIVAEFLGGYTFLNLRSPEKNQCLDESVFYKLTTGCALPNTYSGTLHQVVST